MAGSARPTGLNRPRTAPVPVQNIALRIVLEAGD